MSGKLIWLSVVLIVAGAISITFSVTNTALSTKAMEYVETFD